MVLIFLTRIGVLHFVIVVLTFYFMEIKRMHLSGKMVQKRKNKMFKRSDFNSYGMIKSIAKCERKRRVF